jgi:alkanesulfonate monooxygenase SsuD/methylene tetrahydromethanopterin reductase-like flavin-dependent oxidoreductase (luciferase family)
MKRGIYVAPFNELSDPRVVASLASRAEARGWDGFFVWDHIAYRPPVREVADPWVTLSAIAMTTSRLLLGPMVTPLPRRRPHQLARETVTLDRLSGGRLVLGVGLGSDRSGEFEFPGEEPDPRARARILDASLDKLVEYWEGGFEPGPVSRIPIWVAARWPFRKPLARAARYDGVFPIDQPDPEALAQMLAAIGRGPGYEVVVTNPPGTDWAPWVAAGATWGLTGFGPTPAVVDVERAIDAL